MKAVVVGAGVGGLMVAIRLASDGHDVVVFERNPTIGGKIASLVLDGFSFDLGPTMLTLPVTFDELLRRAGTTLADEVELIRLDPQVRYRWSDGSTLSVPDDETEWQAALEQFSPGAAAQWSRFGRDAEQIWIHSEQAREASRARNRLSRLRIPLDTRGTRLDSTRSLAKSAAAHFDDPRLRQLVGRAATDTGSSPYLAPATFAFHHHLERAFGCWYVIGGLGRLRDALGAVARRIGVEIRCESDVGRVTVAGGEVSGVELADGGREACDVVVADVDAAHLYTELLPSPKQARALDRVRRSASGFLICAGVRGRSDGIAHRNVWFSLDDRAEHLALERGQLAPDPTIYACVSSVTDPSQAPPDCENWYILVSTPPAIGIDRKVMTAAVLNRLAERGADLRHRIDFTRTLVPADFDVRYRALGGAFHGTSSDDRSAAFERPPNVGPVDGLYHVGGSSRPGPGLAMIALGARDVGDLIAAAHGGRDSPPSLQR